jgi:hypothetical protein
VDGNIAEARDISLFNPGMALAKASGQSCGSLADDNQLLEYRALA